MIDEHLRLQLEDAFEKGDHSKALELNRLLDKQILEFTKSMLKVCVPGGGVYPYVVTKRTNARRTQGD